MTTTTSTPATTTTRAASRPASRIAGWTGVAFAIAFITGFLLVAQVPAYDAPDADWVAWVENDNTATVIGTMLLTAAALLLMAFVTSLATHLRGPSRADDPEISVLRGAGVIAGATMLLAALIGGAMPAGVTFAPDFPVPGAELIRSLDQLSIGIMLIGTGWSMAVTIALASWAARRSEVLPSWLSTAGLVAAALLLLSPMFLPFILVPLWAFVTGTIALRSGVGEPGSTSTSRS